MGVSTQRDSRRKAITLDSGYDSNTTTTILQSPSPLNPPLKDSVITLLPMLRRARTSRSRSAHEYRTKRLGRPDERASNSQSPYPDRLLQGRCLEQVMATPLCA
jgi:hypothetical protein